MRSPYSIVTGAPGASHGSRLAVATFAVVAVSLLLSGWSYAEGLDPGAREPATQEPADESSEAATPSKPAVESFRWPGEEFFYSIRLNGAEAMRASVRAGSARTANNQAYVPISGVARSVGFFEKIYPLDDRAHTFVDPLDHRPLRSEKFFEERGKSRTYKVNYKHGNFHAKVEKKREKRRSRYNYSIPDTTHDMLSWMYHLRARDQLAVGDELSYYVYDGWKLSRVDLEVLGKEDVYTPMGWFKGLKIRFVREVMVSRRQKDDDGATIKPLLKMKSPRDKTGFLWLSRDENRLPIKVSIGTKFGTSEALLIKYNPHDKNASNHTASKKKPDARTADSSTRSQAR
ncbi:MAG: DUF3108 domain-containing protein [Persicimonas sp.]